ncbi:hypothetical protein OQZ90_003121 [Listeria monocytogenes]|jgi:predicted DNA-binding protein|nr:hypothetical protein [Moraxella osloensis]EKD1048565.1 hypothetical protein [Listeria monocytogenes]MDI4481706.1 hypothetical protein [Moraxella osloensis]
MQKQRNRVNLTLSDDVFDTLTELSELSGTPRATIIHELIEEVIPQLKVSIELIKKLRANEMQMADAKKVFIDMLMDAGDVLNDAQGQLNNVQGQLNANIRKINDDTE